VSTNRNPIGNTSVPKNSVAPEARNRTNGSAKTKPNTVIMQDSRKINKTRKEQKTMKTEKKPLCVSLEKVLSMLAK